MWLDYNPGLSGTIPAALGQLTNLQSFSLVESSLSGSIPSEIGMAESLVEVWLYWNNLAGSIPDEIGSMLNLMIFEIDGNDITGVMPDDVCELVQNGVLDWLVADCDKVDCPCCTSCNYAMPDDSGLFGGNGDTGSSFEANIGDSNLANTAEWNGKASKVSLTKYNGSTQSSHATHHLRHNSHFN
mmetsp:Transcript_13094/g.20405  ORF Transcript_13094/g.20405 Transcript_13094/m.20405 type:complete len:185 (+) Transcript_13094:1-555(+)